MLVSRRAVLSLAAGGAASVGVARGSLAGTQAADRPLIVFIHGAWQGGWGWKQAMPLLWAAGGAIPVPPEDSWGERWGLTSPELRAWARPRMTPQPALTFTETVNGDPFAQPVRLTDLKCRNNPNPGFWAMTKRIKADPRFTYREIAGPHMVMLTNPQGFTQALLAAL